MSFIQGFASAFRPQDIANAYVRKLEQEKAEEIAREKERQEKLNLETTYNTFMNTQKMKMKELSMKAYAHAKKGDFYSSKVSSGALADTYEYTAAQANVVSKRANNEKYSNLDMFNDINMNGYDAINVGNNIMDTWFGQSNIVGAIKEDIKNHKIANDGKVFKIESYTDNNNKIAYREVDTGIQLERVQYEMVKAYDNNGKEVRVPKVMLENLINTQGYTTDKPKEDSGIYSEKEIAKAKNQIKYINKKINYAKEQGDEEKVQQLSIELQAAEDIANYGASNTAVVQQPEKQSTTVSQEDTTATNNNIFKYGTKGEFAPNMSDEQKKDALSKYPKLAYNHVSSTIDSLKSMFHKTTENSDGEKVKTLEINNTNISKIQEQILATKDLIASNVKLNERDRKLFEKEIKDYEDVFIHRRIDKNEREKLAKADDEDNFDFSDKLEGIVKAFYENEDTGYGETFGDYITGRDAVDTFNEEILPYLNMVMVANGKGKFKADDFIEMLRSDNFYVQDFNFDAPFGLESGKEISRHPILDSLKEVPKLRASLPREKGLIEKATDASIEAGASILKYINTEFKELSKGLSFEEKQDLLLQELKKKNRTR